MAQKRSQAAEDIVGTESYWNAQDATCVTTTCDIDTPPPTSSHHALRARESEAVANPCCRYDDAVFIVWRECVNGSLDRALDAAAEAQSDTVAVDFGTGPGFALRGLSERFERCIGVDISPALVRTATARAAEEGLANTVALVSDLSKGVSLRPAVKRACKAGQLGTDAKVGFGVCANVLLSPDADTRHAILRTVAATLEVGGRCLFVVPSLESRLWMEQIYRLWDEKEAAAEGLTGEGGLFTASNPQKKKQKKSTTASNRPRMGLDDVLNGVMPAGETPTQHYLKEQLIAELGQAGLTVRTVDKVEYNMRTEFAEPPEWMGEARIGRPWDWMAVAEKTSGTTAATAASKQAKPKQQQQKKQKQQKQKQQQKQQKSK